MGLKTKHFNQIVLMVACGSLLAACSSSGGGAGEKSQLSNDMTIELTKTQKANPSGVAFLKALSAKDRAILPGSDLMFADAKADATSSDAKKLNATGLKWLKALRSDCAIDKKKIGTDDLIGENVETRTLSGAKCAVSLTVTDEKKSNLTAKQLNPKEAKSAWMISGHLSTSNKEELVINDAQLRSDSATGRTKNASRTEVEFHNLVMAEKPNERKVASGSLSAKIEGTLSAVMDDQSVVTGQIRGQILMSSHHEEVAVVIQIQTPHGAVVICAHSLNGVETYKLNDKIVSAAEIKSILGTLPLDVTSK